MAMGRLTTLAAGMIKPDGKLPKNGRLEIRGRVTCAYNGTPEVEVMYPGEFSKSHPVTDKAHLAERMTSVLRNKYGASNIKWVELPDFDLVTRPDKATGVHLGPWLTIKAEVTTNG